MNRVFVPSVSFLLIVLLAGGSSGQGVLYEFGSPNEEPEGWFGYSVSGAGDANDDGYDDVVVGACLENADSTDAGRVYVFSGETGALLQALTSPFAHFAGYFGYSVSGAGDVNNDGFDDVVVGAHGEDPGAGPSLAGMAYLFSGETGAPIDTLISPYPVGNGYFGYSVSGAGDANDDGHADVVVGAYGEAGHGGRAYVFSGASGSVLWTLASPQEEPGGNFGFSVSGAGDVNNDGYDDVVVGAGAEDPGTSPSAAGRAYVFDGQTGTVLDTLISPNEEATGLFGKSVSSAGDVDNDGYDDTIVGAYREDVGGVVDAGRAYVFSGQSGAVLYTLTSPYPGTEAFFGWEVAKAGDVDADGYDDVIVGVSREMMSGRAYVFSGQTGGVLHGLVSPNDESGGGFGFSVSAAGCVTCDGRAALVVGAPGEGPGASPDEAGRAYVFIPGLNLWGWLAAGGLGLQWTPCSAAYTHWVYGAANEAYFEPGFYPGYAYRRAILAPGVTTWWTPNGVGVPDSNWTYLVIAVGPNENEMARSNRFGEHDFSTTTGR
jgi:hypothetical protein